MFRALGSDSELLEKISWKNPALVSTQRHGGCECCIGGERDAGQVIGCLDRVILIRARGETDRQISSGGTQAEQLRGRHSRVGSESIFLLVCEAVPIGVRGGQGISPGEAVVKSPLVVGADQRDREGKIPAAAGGIGRRKNGAEIAG